MPLIYDIPAHNHIGIHYSISLESVYKDEVSAPYEHPLLLKDSPLFCVYYSAEGEGKFYLTSDKVFTLKKGQLFFGNQKTLQKIACESGNWTFYAYWFKPLNIDIPSNTVKATSNHKGEDEEAFIDYVIEHLPTASTTRELAQINVKFLERLLDWMDDPNEKVTPPANVWFIEQTIAYIDFNIGQDLSIATLAKNVGFSPKYFRELFLKHTGVLPKKYILNKRLQYAKNLLLSSDYSVDAIANLLGFSSPYHLSMTFKQFTGVSPTEYKKRHKTKK